MIQAQDWILGHDLLCPRLGSASSPLNSAIFRPSHRQLPHVSADALPCCAATQVRARLLKGRPKISGAQAFWLGAGATAVASTITYPFARTRAMLQSTKMSGGAAKEERKRGEIAAMIAIARRKGVTDLYQVKALDPIR